MNKVATRNPVEFGSGNDYVLLVSTRQNKLYSAILFSSKEEHSASKIGVKQHSKTTWIRRGSQASDHPSPM
jgi:hypothetical protein